MELGGVTHQNIARDLTGIGDLFYLLHLLQSIHIPSILSSVLNEPYITNSIGYESRRFNAAFTRPLQ